MYIAEICRQSLAFYLCDFLLAVALLPSDLFDHGSTTVSVTFDREDDMLETGPAPAPANDHGVLIRLVGQAHPLVIHISGLKAAFEPIEVQVGDTQAPERCGWVCHGLLVHGVLVVR